MQKTSKGIAKPIKRRRNAPKSPRNAKDAFTLLLRQHIGVECVKEYRFHPTRKWRFDYAFPSIRVAIEIDGGVWINGRHNRPSGFLGDMEKFNAAATLGWVVLKFTPQEQYSQKTLELITQTIANKMKNGDNR